MEKDSEHGPVRTCVSCGARRQKAHLLRLVLDAGGYLVKDDLGTGPGRGAYVCKNRSCAEKLSGNRRLERAFRIKRTPLIDPCFWSE